MRSRMNRLANTGNPFQGEYKRVLCVCSAGLLRSPTAAEVLSREPFCFNTRAVGASSEYALIRIDDALLTWADEIVCMGAEQELVVDEMLKRYELKRPVLNLNIPDTHAFRSSVLEAMIADRYQKESKK